VLQLANGKSTNLWAEQRMYWIHGIGLWWYQWMNSANNVLCFSWIILDLICMKLFGKVCKERREILHNSAPFDSCISRFDHHDVVVTAKKTYWPTGIFKRQNHFLFCQLYVQCIRESIQTPWLFPHFVMLQPYSKMDEMICSPHKPTHNTPMHCMFVWMFLQ
jgi:hypothetical protein